MINPDTILASLREAIANGHPVIALLEFCKLDEQLCDGGPLPTDWTEHRQRGKGGFVPVGSETSQSGQAEM